MIFSRGQGDLFEPANTTITACYDAYPLWKEALPTGVYEAFCVAVVFSTTCRTLALIVLDWQINHFFT